MAVPRRTLVELHRLANQVGGDTDDTVRALAGSWIAAWDTLSAAWQDAIAVIVDEYRRTGRWPAAWRIARIEAVARAQALTERSLTVLVDEAAVTTMSAATVVSAATATAEPAVITSQQPNPAPIAVPAVVIAAALAARQDRIAALHRPILPATVDTVRQILARPSLHGARTDLPGALLDRTRTAFDSGLTRAATIARTELVDTYRTTAWLVHAANRQTVTGWAWHCVCDLRSCPACWAMHGRTFPLDVPGPAGHPGCRCTRLPLTAGITLPSAEARFRRLPRRQQIAILGRIRWELWRAGRITWADLVMRRTNRRWRDSYVPRPVGDLTLLADRRAA